MSKMPTAEETLSEHIGFHPDYDENYRVAAKIVDIIEAIESHTAAHTAALQERVVALESGETELQELFELRVSMKNLEAENKQLRKILEKINNIVNGTGN